MEIFSFKRNMFQLPTALMNRELRQSVSVYITRHILMSDKGKLIVCSYQLVEDSLAEGASGK